MEKTKSKPIGNRVSEIAQQWFLAEPLLFAAWSSHRIQANERLETIRVGRGMVEFNPAFLEKLDSRMLREVMRFEALRIILKHPYERRKPNAAMAWEASNLALKESCSTSLPMPSALERFGSKDQDGKFFEHYYNLLCETPARYNSECNFDERVSESSAECKLPGKSGGKAEGDADCSSSQPGGNCDSTRDGKAGRKQVVSRKALAAGLAVPEANAVPLINAISSERHDAPDLNDYCEGDLSSIQNAVFWDYDQLITEQINEIITEIEASENWGTIAGGLRELILASRSPRLDYRRVLSAFRASILSTQRRLTRMKPNRRYGFEYMGSRREFSTKLLFAVDVSGSVGTSDVRNAFSIVNRLFKYGIESIDVIWFDTQIRSEEPLKLKRARQSVSVSGRGGTCFQPLMDHLDEHSGYDGLIVFTDGIAPVPDPPKNNRRTRIVWLFNREENWKRLHKALERPGMFSAFVLADS